MAILEILVFHPHIYISSTRIDSYIPENTRPLNGLHRMYGTVMRDDLHYKVIEPVAYYNSSQKQQ
jgi:hypothetical protein